MAEKKSQISEKKTGKLVKKGPAKKAEKKEPAGFINEPAGKPVSRKGFMRSVLAGAGLTLSYGTMAVMIVKFLLPYKKLVKKRIFVATTDNLPIGHTITFSTPNGESYLLTRREIEGEEVYLAYSNRCPHLGCKVLWEQENNRYFCPCHHGVFDTNGVATDGPPAKAGQRLKKCEIELVDKSIYAVVGSSV